MVKKKQQLSIRDILFCIYGLRYIQIQFYKFAYCLYHNCRFWNSSWTAYTQLCEVTNDSTNAFKKVNESPELIENNVLQQRV